jgi:hypothetical protein
MLTSRVLCIVTAGILLPFAGLLAQDGDASLVGKQVIVAQDGSSLMRGSETVGAAEGGDLLLNTIRTKVPCAT